MPPDTAGKNANHPSKVFGLEREAKRPRDPLVVTEETTAWEIYNHKASESDREMIKDWNDSLNTLLIFTALYSAVLTAFIIESMKLLEENPADTTRDILLVVSRQLANASFPAFEPTAYQAPKYAVIVNGLFFTSLSCALIAALLAVLALQWVANYDMGLNTSSPKKRALQRHMRLMGIRKWKMSEIIASLPLLIFVALFLFFIGIADWLWHMNRAISGVVIGGIGIGCLLYTITNLISIINVDAPFRTPISKELAGVVRRIMRWLRQALIALFITCFQRGKRESNARNTMKRRIVFAKQEEKAFERKGSIALDGLVWLANHIEVSSTSVDGFISLLKELTDVPAESLIDDEKIKDAPWREIFEMLWTPYIGKRVYSAEELERARWMCKGMSIIPSFESPICQESLEDLLKSSDQSMISAAFLAYYKQYSGLRLRMAQLGSMDTMCKALLHTGKSTPYIGENYLYFILLRAQKDWSNLALGGRIRVVESMAKAWTIPSLDIRNGSPSIIIPVDLIQFILDFVIPRVEVNTFEARFLAAIQPSGNESRDRAWDIATKQLIRMMAQQLIAQISQNYNSLPGHPKELDLLASIMDSKQLDLFKEKDDFIWVMINKYTGGDERRDIERIGDIICRGLYCKPVELVWTDLALTLDDFVTRLSPSSIDFYSKIIRFVRNTCGPSLSGRPNRTSPNVLAQVHDPCIAWILSWHCPGGTQFQRLLNPTFDGWNEATEYELTRLLNLYGSFYQLPAIIHSDARITFLRAIILDGPSNARTTTLNCLAADAWWESDHEKWHQLFASPVFGAILEQSITLGGFPIHTMLVKMVEYRWFYEEFALANGLAWLTRIALSALHSKDRRLKDSVLAEILVDQILFSTANRDIQAPLLSCYHCLQSLGQALGQTHDPLGLHQQSRQLLLENTRSASSSFSSRTTSLSSLAASRAVPHTADVYRLVNLRIALLWALDSSIKVYDSRNRVEPPLSLEFDPPSLKREYWPTVGDVRSFYFIRDLSSEEWKIWSTRLKVLIMGVSLGGLKHGPFQNTNRFCRDPDGFCGRV